MGQRSGQGKGQQSRRLTPGTVLAISMAEDNFQSICKVAVVAQRPYTEGLEKEPPEIDIFWGGSVDAIFDPARDSA